MVRESTLDEVLASVINSDGEVVLGFRGIGRFRGRSDYDADEQTLLNHFFTNSQSNVYCARDSLPNEMWALLMGQYARSSDTARDRLLALFRDIHKRDTSVASIPQLAALVRGGGDVTGALEPHLRKAGKFIVDYGVDYGHASLRDSGTIRICFEGVSQRATKFLEAAREGAYQEQSTRAIPFSAENLGMPFEIRGTPFESKLSAFSEKLIGLNSALNTELVPFLARKHAQLRGEANKKIAEALGRTDVTLSDAAWNKVINEKAFDVSRSLLPQNMTTSLGVTLNTRRFQDMLTWWRSVPYWEMNVLGAVAQRESQSVFPSLMVYGGPSDFQRQTFMAPFELYDELIGTENPSNLYDLLVHADSPRGSLRNHTVDSRLVSVTPDIEDLVLASILFNGSRGRKSLFELKDHVKSFSPEVRRRIAASQVEGKAVHEVYPKSMEIGSFIFERHYDVGAYRDLHRQRGDRQQLGGYNVIGFVMPPEIEEVGFGDRFREVIDEAYNLHGALSEAGFLHAADYVALMAHSVRHVTTKDPVQCFYEARLRTQPAGIDSYRKVEALEIEQALDHLPAFRGLIPFDSNYYPLNRLPERIDATIKANRNRPS